MEISEVGFLFMTKTTTPKNCCPKNSLGELLDIYSKEDQLNHKHMCSTMFIAALFIITKTWKQPRCLSTKEWIKKMWYIYTMKKYSTVKNNGILKFEGK